MQEQRTKEPELHKKSQHTGTVKPVLSSHSKRTQKLVFKTDYHLMQVKNIAECSKRSILQYFQPSLSYHFSLRPFFCIFLSVHLRQVLLYIKLPSQLSLNFSWLMNSSTLWDQRRNFASKKFRENKTSRKLPNLQKAEIMPPVPMGLVKI